MINFLRKIGLEGLTRTKLNLRQTVGGSNATIWMPTACAEEAVKKMGAFLLADIKTSVIQAYCASV